MAKKPFLWNIVNKLYGDTIQYSPKILKDHPKTSSAIFGIVGTTVLVKTLQGVSKYVIPKFDKKIMPGLETICIYKTGK